MAGQSGWLKLVVVLAFCILFAVSALRRPRTQLASPVKTNPASVPSAPLPPVIVAASEKFDAARFPTPVIPAQPTSNVAPTIAASQPNPTPKPAPVVPSTDAASPEIAPTSTFTSTEPSVPPVDASCNGNLVCLAILSWAKNPPPATAGTIFYDDTLLQGNGGTADRFIGVLNTLLLAVSTGRHLGIHWMHPAPLHDYFEPAFIAWRTAFNFTGNEHRMPCVQVGIAECAHINDLFSESTASARFSSNINWYPGLATFGPYQQAMEKRYKITLAQLQEHEKMALVFRPLWSWLMKPTPKLQEALQPLEAQRKPGLPLACLQLRFGNGAAKDWQDSESFLVASQAPGIGVQLSKMINGSTVQLFVTSDNQPTSKVVADNSGVPESYTIFQQGSAAVHIERSGAEAAAAGFAHVLASFTFLRHCNLGMITERSGFGRLGIWQSLAPQADLRIAVRQQEGVFQPFCVNPVNCAQ